MDYSQEQECFDNICSELALAYSLLPVPTLEQADLVESSRNTVVPAAPDASKDQSRGALGSIIFPALRRHMLPPNEFASDNTVVQVASLERLYRIFERC